MSEIGFYHWLVYIWLGLAAAVFVVLIYIPAPYGRFARPGWGARMSNRVGWVVQETPAALVFLGLYLAGDHRLEAVPLILLILWQIHYLHRAFIYPVMLRGERRQIAVVTVCLAVVFNSGNAYLNARWLYSLGSPLPPDRLLDPRFILGASLFVVGFAANRRSDLILIRLRAPGEHGYAIPRGGLFRYVSCPNYLGEIVQWAGWALMAYNLGALSFLAWTAANLAPRAFATHRWYRERFPEYPPERKALIPFIA